MTSANNYGDGQHIMIAHVAPGRMLNVLYGCLNLRRITASSS